MSAYFNSILFILLVFFNSICLIANWDYRAEGTDWDESCKKGPQAPIDISAPFLFKDIDIQFFYSNMMTEYSLYQDGNNLQVDGDFGYVQYEKGVYVSSHLLLFSPSQHTFRTNRFPLEMQIVHQDPEGNKVTICFMFKESKIEYSILLGKLFFDDPSLLELNPNEKRTIKEPINLSKYISTEKDFFVYEALEPAPPCNKQNTFFLLTDILNANANQLLNFPSMVKNQRRVMQLRSNRKIWITIPMEQIAAKIAGDRKIRDENERRELKNQELNSIQEKLLVKANLNKTEEEVRKPIETGTENQLVVTIPFDTIKQKVIAREKTSKKVDMKLISNHLQNSNGILKYDILIDKDIPRTEGEILRDELKHKYLIWRSIYKDFIEGKMISQNPQTNPSLVQMKTIEKELKDNNYSPYINDIIEMNTNDNFGSSFIQLPQKHKHEQHVPMRNASLSKKGKRYPSLFMQLQSNPIAINGRRALNDHKDIEVMDSSNWPRECNVAQYKSPIQIDGKFLKEDNPLYLNLTGPNNNLLLSNDGFKIIASVTNNGDFGSIKHGDHSYQIKRLFIHSPSIHTIGEGEKRSAMEIQLLSNDDFGNHAAISVLFDIGKESNAFLKAIGFDTDMNPIYNLQLRNNGKVEIRYTKAFDKELNLLQFFAPVNERRYVSYMGTTSTPPCKSNVKWFVCLNKQSVSQNQLNHFPILFGRKSNIRGLQPLNNRIIKINNSQN